MTLHYPLIYFRNHSTIARFSVSTCFGYEMIATYFESSIASRILQNSAHTIFQKVIFHIFFAKYFMLSEIRAKGIKFFYSICVLLWNACWVNGTRETNLKVNDHNVIRVTSLVPTASEHVNLFHIMTTFDEKAL